MKKQLPAAIVGVSTGFIRGAGTLDPLDMIAHVATEALNEAGLSLKDVDGLFAGMQREFLSTLAVGEYLGIRPRFSDNNRLGGSSFLAHTEQAALALAAGKCDVALIVYGSNQRSSVGKLQTAVAADWSPTEAPYGARFPVSSYALAAARHMYEYGTTREHLAAVAVSARQWAQRNPEAFSQAPLTIDDVLSERMISSPLGKLDCCLVTDGAGAIVMVNANRAKDLATKPVYLAGSASEHWHKQISAMPDLCSTAASVSSARALKAAKMQLSDIDVVQIYDAFTISTLMILEDLGFCPKGEGGPFVSEGHIAPGGMLPVNTSGGGLSYGHPGMFGIFILIEGVRQLRGEAGDRQVQGAKVCLCQGSGGTFSSQITNILALEEALYL